MINQAIALGWEEVVSACGGCRAALKGSEIHVEFTREGVINRRKVREFLGPLIDRMGFLTTRVPVDDEDSDRFVRRIGFRESGRTDEFIFYMLTGQPFSRKEH